MGKFGNGFGVAVAAGAGEGFNARFFAGGLFGDRFGVGVVELGQRCHVAQRFAANLADRIFRASCRAGRRNGHGFGRVGKLGNGFGVALAAGTGKGFDTFFLAGGLFGDRFGVGVNVWRCRIKMNSRVQQIVVAAVNRNRVPLLLCAMIIAVGQSGAVVEGIFPDARDAVGDGHARQSSAAVEGTTADARDAVGDGERSAFVPTRVLDQFGFVLVIEHAEAVRGIVGIAFADRYGRQPGAVVESITADARDAVGDGHARQTGAVPEGRIADALDAVGNGHARQTFAVLEGTIADARDAVGNGHARQTGAVVKGIIADARDAVGDGHARQTGASAEDRIADARDAVGDDHARQTGAVVEGSIADTFCAGFDLVSSRKRLFGFNQMVADVKNIILPVCAVVVIRGVIKCSKADARDAVGDGHARQPGAAAECIIADARDTVGDGDTRQPSAVLEGRFADARDAAVDHQRLHGVIIRLPWRGGDISAVIRIVMIIVHLTRSADGQGFGACVVTPCQVLATSARGRVGGVNRCQRQHAEQQRGAKEQRKCAFDGC